MGRPGYGTPADPTGGNSSLDGIQKIKRTINLIYRTQGREEDKQDWLQQILGRFEAYMKKIYYMSNQTAQVSDLDFMPFERML